MPDNKEKVRQQNSSMINDYEVRYRAKKFGCIKGELRKTVEKAGVSIVTMENYFQTIKFN